MGKKKDQKKRQKAAKKAEHAAMRADAAKPLVKVESGKSNFPFKLYVSRSDDHDTVYFGNSKIAGDGRLAIYEYVGEIDVKHEPVQTEIQFKGAKKK